MTRGFVAWARERAIDLEGFEDPAFDVERLAPLDPLLEGRRFAFLGEASHWVHQKYAYRLLLIRYLHSRGWRVVGEELAWSDGHWIARYLETGDEAHLGRVTAYGYTGGARDDRDDAPTGVLKDGLAHYPKAELRAEQTRFARALCAFNQSLAAPERLRFFGFDVDYDPWAGYALVETLPGATELGDLLRRVEGESLDDEIARLRACHDRAAGLEPSARYRDLVRAVRTLWLSHAYVRLAHPAPTYAALGPALSLRERLMHEHVRHVLEGTGDRVVLMSHNAHLAKDGARVASSGPDSSGPGGDRAPPLGTALHREHAGRVFAVWMLQGRGADCNPLPRTRRIRSPRGTLNRKLSRVGATFALPTRSDDPRARPLQAEARVMSLYGTRLRLVPADQADALLFVRDVSPLQG